MGRVKDLVIEKEDLRAGIDRLEREVRFHRDAAQESFHQFRWDTGLDHNAEADLLDEQLGRMRAKLSYLDQLVPS